MLGADSRNRLDAEYRPIGTYSPPRSVMEEYGG